MALDLDNFKEVGGPGNSAIGGQVYSIFSPDDAVGAMMVSGYLDNLSGTLNSQDTVILTGTDGTVVAMVTNTAGVITVASVATTGIASTLSGAGAVPITARSADLTSTSTDAWTLADGAIGQLLNITMVVDGGTAVLTPANGLGYSTVTFADAGDSVQLEFKSGGWAVIGQGGLSTGPVVA